MRAMSDCMKKYGCMVNLKLMHSRKHAFVLGSQG
jgi:hypothetical protein